MRVIFQWSLLSAIYSRKYGNLSKQMVIDMSATPNENEQKNKQWVWELENEHNKLGINLEKFENK